MSALLKKIKLLAEEKPTGVSKDDKEAYAYHKDQVKEHKKWANKTKSGENMKRLHTEYMEHHSKKADAIRSKYKPSVWAASHGK